MRTHDTAAEHTAATPEGSVVTPRNTQRVLIVNGDSDVLEMLEPVLDAGNYDVIFVESTDHAYSQIRRVRPDLVILCLAIDDADTLNVLSMLKLDADTRAIPVITCTAPPDDDSDEPEEEEVADDSDQMIFSQRPAQLMN